MFVTGDITRISFLHEMLHSAMKTAECPHIDLFNYSSAMPHHLTESEV